MPPNTVKVDRGTRWGNPFKVGVSVLSCRGREFRQVKLRTAEQAVGAFRAMLALQSRNYPTDLTPLRGKNLACWCGLDSPWCHADVLLDLANRD